MPRVLITDGAYKHTLGAVRHLARAGFRVDCIGEPRCRSSWSRYLDRVTLGTEDFTDATIDRLVETLARERYDVMLPIGASSVARAARHRAIIEPHCALPVAPLDLVELCFDKERTAAFAAEHGVPAPRTWHVADTANLPTLLPEIVYPVVVKGHSELDTFQPVYVHDEPALHAAIQPWIDGPRRDTPPPVIQQRISGPGEGFFALYDRGRCLRIFMHRRLRETPPSGGPSCCARSIFEEDLKTLGTRLLDAVGWHGAAMAEFKRDAATGQLYLIEINPKFWGSLDLALDAGVNFPALASRMAMGEHLEYDESYRVGRVFHWPLDGEIKHVLKRPTAIGRVLRDCLDPRVHSNLWLRDPLPTMYRMLSSIPRGAPAPRTTLMSATRTIRLLFHVHTRHSHDGIMSPRRLVRACRRRGIDVLVIADHDSDAALDQAIAAGSSAGVLVVPAVEYNSTEGDIIGLLCRGAIDRTSGDRTIQTIKERGGVVVLPHPAYAHRLDEIDLAAVDVVETFNARCSPAANTEAERLAERLNRPKICGADAHLPWDLGTCVNEYDLPDTDDDMPTEAQVRESVLAGGRLIIRGPCPRASVPLSQMVKAVRRRSPRLFVRQGLSLVRRYVFPR